MEQPVCCARDRGACGSAHAVQVRGERIRVETAKVHNDGTTISSATTLIDWQETLPRHACGRRPQGFSPCASGRASSLGAELAEMAELEAASVFAFARLANELKLLGAPPQLVARARDAKADEARHTRVVSRLARHHGVAPPLPRMPPWQTRSRADIARENAVEGCVFETFGAAVATFQAERSEDEELRAVFREIAEDERRHAALAWDVSEWLAEGLTADERAEVRAAQAKAIQLLKRGIASQATPPCQPLGMPDWHEARAMAELCFDG